MTISSNETAGAREPGDRRVRLRTQNRERILRAAEELLLVGTAAVSIGTIADRADVARRTLFNHFHSLEDVLVAACEQRFWQQYDRGTSEHAEGGHADVDILTAVMSPAFYDAVMTVDQMIRGAGPQRADALRSAVTDRVQRAAAIQTRLTVAAPQPLAADFLVAALASGIRVIVQQLHRASDPHDCSRSPRMHTRWEDAVGVLVVGVRDGFRPASPSGSGTVSCSRQDAPAPDRSRRLHAQSG